MIDWEQRLPNVHVARDGFVLGVTSYEKGYLVGLRRFLGPWLEAQFGPLDKRAMDTFLSLFIDEMEALIEVIPTAESLSDLGLED